jgi:hypothetical protein
MNEDGVVIIIYVHERDVDAYYSQGWICHRLKGPAGQRRHGLSFICVRGEE